MHCTSLTTTTTTPQTQLCTSSSCSVCNIIRSGFDVSYAQPGRYGKGLYFSATSSKSIDYTSPSATNGMRYMFIASVTCGKVWKPTQSLWQHAGNPTPAGYHSVCGDPRAATDLNYDEVVIYDNAAVLPRYLLLLKPGPLPSGGGGGGGSGGGSGGTCGASGCTKSVHVDKRGRAHPYCSKRCARKDGAMH